VLKAFAPQLVNAIHKPKDSNGYDLDSFQQIGKNIRNVQIEVKTTTNKDPYNAFFMSKNEYQTMCDNPSTYWLYRVSTSTPTIRAVLLFETRLGKRSTISDRFCLFT
jgi:hypothetical protein